MRNVLTLGVLGVIVLLIVVNGPSNHPKFTLLARGQTAAAVMMYDEYGNPEVIDEAYPGSITNSPYDVFYADPYYVQSQWYPDYSYGASDNTYYYSPSGSSYDYNYYAPPAPPLPPPQPWYYQALPGIGSVAQTIVQGIAPQTRPAPAPTCSIVASPSTVPYDGSSILQWVSQGAQWADLTELGIVDTSGSWQFDGFTRSRTFVLSLSGPGGNGSCSTVVTVRPR